MRTSTASVALIRRLENDETLWLAQWNPKWDRYHFIGGHKHDDETFCECIVREIEEELDLCEGRDYRVTEEPEEHLEYRAWSNGSRQETEYTIELFSVEGLTQSAEHKIQTDSDNRWLTEQEIRAKCAADGRPVSETMWLLLSKAKLVSCAKTPDLGETSNHPPDLQE